MSLIPDVWMRIIKQTDIITICRCSNICQELYKLLEQYVAQIKYVNNIHIIDHPYSPDTIDVYHGQKSYILNTRVMSCITPYRDYSCIIRIDDNPFSAAIVHHQTDKVKRYILFIEDRYLNDDHISGTCRYWQLDCELMKEFGIDHAIMGSGEYTFRDGILIDNEISHEQEYYGPIIWMHPHLDDPVPTMIRGDRKSYRTYCKLWE